MIPSAQGGDLQVRFSFDTVDDLYNDFEGWYIDDIYIVS